MKNFLSTLVVLGIFSTSNAFASQTYNEAIDAAINNALTPSSYYTSNLRKITDSNTATKTTGSTPMILVSTFTKASYNTSNVVGTTKTVYGNANADSMWVTLAPDLYNFLSNKGVTAEQAHNEMAKAAGMNTTTGNDMVLEFWAVKDVDHIQRPTLVVDPTTIPTANQLGYPSPKGTATYDLPADWSTKTTNIVTSSGTTTMTLRDAYIQWYEGFIESALNKKTFPWTQLGYTYYWGTNNNLSNIIGLSEFVVRRSPNPDLYPLGYDYEVNGIFSQQSYIYRTYPTGQNYQTLPSNGDFHITGNLDTLWAGRRYQPSGNSIIIDTNSKVSGGQGILVSSVGYTVNNAGEISGSTSTKYGISDTSNVGILFLGEDPSSTGNGNTITNTGTIQNPGTGIEARDATGINADTTITNTGGTIEGGNYAILTHNGDDTVTSSSNSTITGNVDLGAGTNTLTLDSSQMIGNLVTGTGTDAVNIKNNSIFNGNLTTGTGDDTVNIEKSYYKGHLDMGGDVNDTLKVTAGSTLDFATGTVQNENLGNFQLLPSPGSSGINLNIDVNLKDKTGDFLETVAVSDSENLNISAINQVGTIPTETSITIPTIETTDGLAAKTQLGVSSIMTPILKYKVNYNTTTGNLLFTGGGSNADGFNPAVLPSSVAALTGGFINQVNAYNEAFANVDMIMLKAKAEKQALKNRNKIASAGGNIAFQPLMTQEEQPGVWFRPYSSFENVPLNNGPTVSNVGYGSLVGGDSPIKKLKNGFESVMSGYVGYNGSHQAYSGVGIYQNGGLGGLTGTIYKGNFFSALTANVGASSCEATTGSGRNDFTMFTTGIASKTGYNWELLEGKFIIQPSYLMSYTFVNTSSYTNSDGINISSAPLNAIQIVPGIKFIGNLKNGWQPYLGVNMIWNLLDKTDFSANDVALPQMSIAPYVEYGAGLQKRIGERFTGYFQTMLRNGGRNGVSLQAGLRWSI